MGKFSRDKGARFERWIVRKLQDLGFAAERVPLSGAAQGRFGGDISIPLLGRDYRFEAKKRAHGFVQIREWLKDHDGLIIGADHEEPVVVIPWRLAVTMAVAAEHTLSRAELVERSEQLSIPSL